MDRIRNSISTAYSKGKGLISPMRTFKRIATGDERLRGGVVSCLRPRDSQSSIEHTLLNSSAKVKRVSGEADADGAIGVCRVCSTSFVAVDRGFRRELETRVSRALSCRLSDSVLGGGCWRPRSLVPATGVRGGPRVDTRCTNSGRRPPLRRSTRAALRLELLLRGSGGRGVDR